MKKIVSILLVSMLIFNSAGYVLMYFQLKYFFKKESFRKITSNLPDSEVSRIALSIEEYNNQNENFYFVEPHEIKYFGKMYDITRIETKADSVIIYALSDENEDALNDLFAMYFSMNLNDKYSRTVSFLNHLIQDAGLPIEFNGTLSWREDKCNFFIFVPVLNTYLDIPTPPPKV
ncbi:MAG: hypothetical protein MUE56_02000 [Ignavibacteria bacterium]|nr:hypothetical protein [Ignavibacteria bacterium]